MNTLESTPFQIDPQNILATAVAHHIQHMSKEELQTLVEKVPLDLQKENAVLQQRVKSLEEKFAKLLAENERLMYKISRSFFNEKDYENFDPSEYTIPVEEMLAEADKLLED